MAQRKLKAVDTEETREEDAEPIESPFQLEPMDDELRSQLHVWGNSTLLAISRIEDHYPGWTAFLKEMFDVVGQAIEQ